MSGRALPLHPRQLDAVDPTGSVWLSASAGTGKTQVLTARVLRLLLRPGVRPDQILCITFTKAGAAEMAERIHARLASWVRMDDDRLFDELRAIGAECQPGDRERARTLFAAVLDTPGGGLRIQTIHAFCQSLLGAFPAEAGMAPGFRPLDDRDRERMAREVLGSMVTEAQASGDRALLAMLERLSLDGGEDAVAPWLMRCADAEALWFGPGGWTGDLRPRVNALLGLPRDEDGSGAAAMCADDAAPLDAIRACAEVNRQWRTATGDKRCAAMNEWLAASPGARLAGLRALQSCFLTGKGTPLADNATRDKAAPGYAAHADAIIAWLEAVAERQALCAYADRATGALTIGRAFAFRWQDAKAREGVAEFGDLIRRAAELVGGEGIGEWIRFKLDRRFDHVLVDEAQDTNLDQWAVVRGLVSDFFTGIGAHGERDRTLFTVGDVKQAIFAFQGTSPRAYAQARMRFRAMVEDGAQTMREPSLSTSFRTAQCVLDCVDRVIAAIGPGQMGPLPAVEPHAGAERPGSVTLWQAVPAEVRSGDGSDDGDGADEPEPAIPGDEDGEGEDAPETWLSRADRVIAERIAASVKDWLDRGLWLDKHQRAARPGDIMILLRKRKELAGLIVARLHGCGVPVAGLDRMRLGGPLAVQDLLAAMRFAVQPRDDLSLAGLLVSPIGGWTQEELLQWGWRERGGLWERLRRGDVPAERLEPLYALLARADYATPSAFLEWLLSGPLQARAKLLARLGREAADPVAELVNAAFRFEAEHPPSLQGFLDWFGSGEGELKRDGEGGADLVRVMTVHGSKGLQAPVVVIADAGDDPDRGKGLAFRMIDQDGLTVPLPAPRKAERVGSVLGMHDALCAEERQEHWRLLYVAMTRTEEHLFIAGAERKKPAGMPEHSWYACLDSVFAGDGRDPYEEPVWGRARLWGQPPRLAAPRDGQAAAAPLTPEPAWLDAPAPAEPRPPRPLAPSQDYAGAAASPPRRFDGIRAAAARRGTLIHRLVELLPHHDPASRDAIGDGWLVRREGLAEADARRELVAAARRVIEDPDFADLFGPGTRAEVPLAAMVGGQVVTGTIDRLMVQAGRVAFVDFKTTPRPPAGPDGVPPATLRQMAAYAAALAVIYPGRRIEAALLYTELPVLWRLEPERLDLFKPG